MGCLDADLGNAVRMALDLDKTACRAFAKNRSWRRSAEQFFDSLAPCRP